MFEEAYVLFFEMVIVTEVGNNVEKVGVSPWYYEELDKYNAKNYDLENLIHNCFKVYSYIKGVRRKKIFERLENNEKL